MTFRTSPRSSKTPAALRQLATARIEIREGGGCVSLFGLPSFAAGEIHDVVSQIPTAMLAGWLGGMVAGFTRGLFGCGWYDL